MEMVVLPGERTDTDTDAYIHTPPRLRRPPPTASSTGRKPTGSAQAHDQLPPRALQQASMSSGASERPSKARTASPARAESPANQRFQRGRRGRRRAKRTQRMDLPPKSLVSPLPLQTPTRRNASPILYLYHTHTHTHTHTPTRPHSPLPSYSISRLVRRRLSPSPSQQSAVRRAVPALTCQSKHTVT